MDSEVYQLTLFFTAFANLFSFYRVEHEKLYSLVNAYGILKVMLLWESIVSKRSIKWKGIHTRSADVAVRSSWAGWAGTPVHVRIVTTSE